MKLPYDLSKTGRTAATFLLIYCGAELVLIWHGFQMLDFYDALENDNLTQGEMNALAERVTTVGSAVYGLFILAILACYITCGMWIYRAASNAQMVTPGADRITPGWSVGWFFVPFANLVMPYKAMRQTWNGLHSTQAIDGPMPGWAIIWWLAWVLGNLLAMISLWINTDAMTIDEFRLSTQLDFASSAAALVGAFLFRRLILELTHRSASASPHSPDDSPEPLRSIRRDTP